MLSTLPRRCWSAIIGKKTDIPVAPLLYFHLQYDTDNPAINSRYHATDDTYYYLFCRVGCLQRLHEVIIFKQNDSQRAVLKSYRAEGLSETKILDLFQNNLSFIFWLISDQYLISISDLGNLITFQLHM